MTRFDVIDYVRLTNCLALLRVMAESGRTDVTWVRRLYDEVGQHFEETCVFLSTLRLIDVRGNYIIPRSEMGRRVDHSVFLNRLLRDNHEFGRSARDFLGCFKLKEGSHQYKPSLEATLRTAGIRNLLIELEVVEPGDVDGEYTLIDERVIEWLGERGRRPTSRRRYEEQLANKRKLGAMAEMEILRFEQERLADAPRLASLIEYTAEEDVHAGYDIRSFDLGCGEDGGPVVRLIEVKAVSGDDFGFHWSSNEIECARHWMDRYYLYLLPSTGPTGFDATRLMMIRNPIRLFDEPSWQRSIDSYSFHLVTATCA